MREASTQGKTVPFWSYFSLPLALWADRQAWPRASETVSQSVPFPTGWDLKRLQWSSAFPGLESTGHNQAPCLHEDLAGVMWLSLPWGRRKGSHHWYSVPIRWTQAGIYINGIFRDPEEMFLGFGCLSFARDFNCGICYPKGPEACSQMLLSLKAVLQEPITRVSYTWVRKGSGAGAVTASSNAHGRPPQHGTCLSHLITHSSGFCLSVSHRSTPAATQGASKTDVFVWGTRVWENKSFVEQMWEMLPYLFQIMFSVKLALRQEKQHKKFWEVEMIKAQEWNKGDPATQLFIKEELTLLSFQRRGLGTRRMGKKEIHFF